MTVGGKTTEVPFLKPTEEFRFCSVKSHEANVKILKKPSARSLMVHPTKPPRVEDSEPPFQADEPVRNVSLTVLNNPTSFFQETKKKTGKDSSDYTHTHTSL